MSRRIFLGGMLAASLLPQWARAQAAGDRLQGLDATGTTDVTAALQKAADAAGDGGVLVFPPGNFLVSGTVLNPFNRQQWIGAGRGVTRIIYAPRADGALFRFGKTSGITPQQSLRGMTITSNDGNYRKTALEVIDISDFVMEDIEITSTKPAAGTLSWTGGTGGSIGVRTFGREAPRFGGSCYISADNPFRISKNQRAFSPQIDADFFSLRDVYMIAHGQPNILVDGDVELTNLLVDGCSMVRGTNAIRWIGNGATRAASQFQVRNSRWEQAEDPTAYAFDIQPDRNLYGLAFDGVTVSPGANGFRLRNCVAPSFRQIVCSQGSGRDVLNVDASVTLMRHENCLWGVGATATMAGQRVVWASSRTSSREPLPRNALYDSDRGGEVDLGFDGALAGRTVTLADRGVEAVGTAQSRGWLLVSDDAGGACQLALRGAAKAVFYSPALDASGNYSATPGKSQTTNVYWSVRNGRYEIENLRGASHVYRLALVGTSGPRPV
jgi:hypothetical protein